VDLINLEEGRRGLGHRGEEEAIEIVGVELTTLLHFSFPFSVLREVKVVIATMRGDDLHLDVRIRDWVLIPVAIVTFCMGIMLQSLGILVRRPPKIHQHKIREGATLTRLGQFKRNAGVLPPDQFASRLAFFVEGDDAFLNQPKPEKSFLNSFMSPDFMASQLTESMLSFLPQMGDNYWKADLQHGVTGVLTIHLLRLSFSQVFGAFIRYTFGGFTVCKVPFPLPQRFGSMLQSGIEV